MLKSLTKRLKKSLLFKTRLLTLLPTANLAPQNKAAPFGAVFLWAILLHGRYLYMGDTFVKVCHNALKIMGIAVLSHYVEDDIFFEY